ncbi:MAG: hypothetical protein DME98_02285 [Verrucomicrobia bacterium]|nr:MAG: hypothetical protein DME98_02285 [Verrucomicrobiota bacterium]
MCSQLLAFFPPCDKDVLKHKSRKSGMKSELGIQKPVNKDDCRAPVSDAFLFPVFPFLIKIL